LGLILLASLGPVSASWAAPGPSEPYGAKGIFPVYEVSGQWVIYDRKALGKTKPDPRLKQGLRFLVVGSAGAAVFSVEGSTAGWGAACKGAKPLKLRAAVLEGPRKDVGVPIIGISVPPKFSLKKPLAGFRTLSNQVGEETYGTLLGPIKGALRSELSSRELKPKTDEDAAAAQGKPGDLAAEAAVKIDFGAPVSVAGLKDAFALVEGSQVAGTYRRCLRLADLARESGGARFLGECAPMRHELMTETARLAFVSYEPSGPGKPLILAYTPTEPLWGHERWGFALRKSGPRLFLNDSMDIRCREGF
jgi:hypothetical protein